MVPSHGVFALGGKNRYADKRYFATENPYFLPDLKPNLWPLGSLEPLVTTKSGLEKAVLTSLWRLPFKDLGFFRVIFALSGTPINVIFAARSDADKRYLWLSLRRHLFFWTPGKVIFAAASSLRR